MNSMDPIAYANNLRTQSRIPASTTWINMYWWLQAQKEVAEDREVCYS